MTIDSDGKDEQATDGPFESERAVETWWWERPNNAGDLGYNRPEILRRCASIFGGRVKCIRVVTRTTTTILADNTPGQDAAPVTLDLLTLTRWTHANKRAARDYYARPTRACRRHPDCLNLAAGDDPYCGTCRTRENEANQRRRELRARKAAE